MGKFNTGGVAMLAVALLMPLPAPASSQVYYNKKTVDNCQNASLDPDNRIAACTTLIHSNIFPPWFKAIVLAHRATAYRDKGDTVDEVQDVTQALQDRPDDPKALALRDEINAAHPGTIPVTQ